MLLNTTSRDMKNLTPPTRDESPTEPSPRPSDESSARAKRLDSRVLFAGGKELVIFHYGETYCLRETRQRKLILTK
jgi:hemin uptake protein HemP